MMIIFVENPKDYRDKLLELISEFSKTKSYKNQLHCYKSTTNGI